MDEYTTWLKVADQESFIADDYGFDESNTNLSDYNSSIPYDSSQAYAEYNNTYGNSFTNDCTPTDKNEFCVCQKLDETGNGKVHKNLVL